MREFDCKRLTKRNEYDPITTEKFKKKIYIYILHPLRIRFASQNSGAV